MWLHSKLLKSYSSKGHESLGSDLNFAVLHEHIVTRSKCYQAKCKVNAKLARMKQPHTLSIRNTNAAEFANCGQGFNSSGFESDINS